MISNVLQNKTLFDNLKYFLPVFYILKYIVKIIFSFNDFLFYIIIC